MGDQVKPDAEVVTHNALGHVLDHPHVQVRTAYFKDSSRTGATGPIYTKCRRQYCNNSAMILALLFSLKSTASLENGLQPYSGVTLLFSTRTVLLASLQSCRSVDADTVKAAARLILDSSSTNACTCASTWVENTSATATGQEVSRCHTRGESEEFIACRR